MRRWARRGYLAALIGLAAGLAVLRRDEVRALVSGTRLGPLALALALGLVSLAQSAWFWSRALRGMGAPLAFGPVLRATVTALPARYLPGSVWYAAGRVVQLRNLGAPTSALGTVAAIETALSFAVAVALGGALAAVTGLGAEAWVGLAVGAVLLAGIGSPWGANAALALLERRRISGASGSDVSAQKTRATDAPVASEGTGQATPVRLRWATYAELCAHMVAFWAASAVAFVAYLHAFPALDLPALVQVAGQFLLAWAAGFVAVFAPQGAGVFEVSMAALLAAGAPTAALGLVIAGYRGLVAVRDVLALLFLATWRGSRFRPWSEPRPRGWRRCQCPQG